MGAFDKDEGKEENNRFCELKSVDERSIIIADGKRLHICEQISCKMRVDGIIVARKEM